MKDYRVMYLRSSYPVVGGMLVPGLPIGCVAIRVNGRKVELGLSVLNPADKFDRTLARELASARLNEHPTVLTVVGARGRTLNMHEITEAVMGHLASDKDVPSRARKAGKVWLETFTY